MYSFVNDYSEGASADVIKVLIQENFKQQAGYGMDENCREAADLIKKAIGKEDVDVHFITGGTPCNVIALSHVLRPYQAAICVESGHINTHETGALEATGHKIVTCKGKNGKITCEEIEEIVKNHPDEHMVQPKLVFVSDSTEIGTIYSKAELEAISKTCRKLGLYLYLDGARLGSALMSSENELTLNDIANLTDMFYIGGTKNGALLGEAMVIVNDDLKPNFRYTLKQKCAMLAKSFVVGAQFKALFTNDLYFKNAKHANKMAAALKSIFEKNGIEFLTDSSTNQIFPILKNSTIEKMSEKYSVSIWSKFDDEKTVVRFVTSWATKEEAVVAFYEDFPSYL